MQYRTLGNSNLSLSELCFGPMRWDDVKEGEKAFNRAVDLGVNVIHSSYEYNTIDQLGACIGKHSKRNQLHHIIKVSTPDYGETRFDKQLFRKRVEDALKTLHTDCIDVVQHLHRTVSKDIVYHKEGNPERLAGFSEVTEELLETFEQLKQEGKVKYLASFPMTTAYAKKVVNSGKYQALAGYYNPIETEMASLFPEMKQQGMGYIAIRPLLAGLLTDKRANRDQLPEDSSLRDHSWDDAYQLFDKVKEVVPASEISWESFAIKFCLADPTVTTTVMGLNNPAQVEAAVKAANGVYPDAELVQQVWNTIAKHRKERNTWPPY